MSDRRQTVAAGSGWALIHARDDPFHDYLLRLSAAALPRVLLLPTASGDHPSTIAAFYSTYDSGRCRPSHLALFDRQAADLRAVALAQDIIWVDGGNTANMLAVWANSRVSTRSCAKPGRLE